MPPSPSTTTTRSTERLPAEAQQQGRKAAAAHRRAPTGPAVEWPTLLVAVAIYGGWGTLTWFHQSLPAWLLPLAGGYLVCWHGSLQHEVVHGHPTRWARLNRALAWPPLGLWLPFEVYRRTHLAHHRTPDLTVPGLDPESAFVSHGDWNGAGRLRRWLLGINATLAGRVLLGPWLTVAAAWHGAARHWHERRVRRVWLVHAGGVALVLTWTGWVCGLPWWLYLAAFAWPGLGLTLVRSYAEHRPDPDPTRRTVNVHGSPWMALLYLNNNHHVAHHACPAVPWYRLPAVAHGERPALSYRELVWRYALRARAGPVHPRATPAGTRG